MFGVFLPIIVEKIIAYLMEELRKWGGDFNWGAFEETLKSRIADLIPGTQWDFVGVWAVTQFVKLLKAYFEANGVTLSRNVSSSHIRAAVAYANENTFRTGLLANPPKEKKAKKANATKVVAKKARRKAKKTRRKAA